MPRYLVKIEHEMEVEADDEYGAYCDALAFLGFTNRGVKITEITPPLCNGCFGSGEGRHEGMKCRE